MNSTSRRIVRRVSSFRRGGVALRAVPALLLAPVVLFLLLACGPRPPVTTSTGAVVPAAVVEAQDTVADIISEMSKAYRQAVIAHDARAGSEDPALHKLHRDVLIDVKAGLRASAHSLSTWKAASDGAAPAEVIRPLAASIRSFLTLAVELNVLKPERAEAIRAFIDTAFPVGGAR